MLKSYALTGFNGSNKIRQNHKHLYIDWPIPWNWQYDGLDWLFSVWSRGMAVSVAASRFSVGSWLLAFSIQASVGISASAAFSQDVISQNVILTRPTPPVETAPFYPPDAPPSRRTPLPDRRQDIEEQTVGADYRISALQRDSKGALWVGSWQGLAKIDPNTGRILQRVGLPNPTVGALAQDRSGRIWVGTYEGLVRIDPRSGEITAQNFALPSNRVLSMLVDRRGYLWVGTDAGLALISPDQGLLMTTVRNLPGVSANALALDPLGNLWVGTLSGLVQVNTASALLMRQIDTVPGKTIQTLDFDDWGMLWMGTPTGLYQADVGIQRTVQWVRPPSAKPAAKSTRAGKGRSPYRPSKKGNPRSTRTASKPVPPVQKIVFVVTDPTLFRLRTVNQLQGRNVMALHFDRVNSIWVGTTTGLLRVNPFNGATGGEIPYLPSSRVFSLAPDTGGKLWVGTSEGLAWVSTETFRGKPHATFLPVGR